MLAFATVVSEFNEADGIWERMEPVHWVETVREDWLRLCVLLMQAKNWFYCLISLAPDQNQTTTTTTPPKKKKITGNVESWELHMCKHTHLVMIYKTFFLTKLYVMINENV